MFDSQLKYLEEYSPNDYEDVLVIASGLLRNVHIASFLDSLVAVVEFEYEQIRSEIRNLDNGGYATRLV